MLDPVLRTVLQMMARWGGNATLIVNSGDGTYDPATGSTTSSVQTYQVRVMVEDYIQKASGIASQAGGLVQTGDKRIFMKPDAGVPTPRVGVDYLIFEGRKWTPITMKEYNPSGTNPYLYEMYARQ